MNRKKGFTVIELLAVIAIIAILAGILVVTVTGALRFFSEGDERDQLSQIETALEIYKSNYGEYPPDGTDVGAIRKHILKRWPELLKDGAALQSCIQEVPGGGGARAPMQSLSFWLCGDEFLPDGTSERFAGSFIELNRGFNDEKEIGTEQPGVNWNINEKPDVDIIMGYLCDTRGYPVIYFRGGVLRNGESIYNGKSVTLTIDGADVNIAPYTDSKGRYYAPEMYQLILPGVDGDFTRNDDNVTNFTAGATMDSESP